MSGLEALSLVCSIMQVISFTKELIMTCKDIYEGRATADDQLQENTASIKSLLDDMNQCSGSVQQRTQNERDLHEIARKCSIAAQDLESEIRRLTRYHKPGNVMKALVGGIKSTTRERKIKELSKSFRQYQETLETHILARICTKTDALRIQQGDNFNELSDTLQHFISQIAAGHTEVANLINRHGIETRQQIQQSEMGVKTLINARHVEADMEAKRSRLLQSLKFESMNARRTEIKIANEATYVSFFKSLEFKKEPTSGSAAVAWANFVKWLQSDEQTFWIQGKPGAGKSTLVKFLFQHENTKKALDKWNHNSIIVSHFFWKPGNILQRNFRGLLCSLNHQLLSAEPSLIDQILSEFKSTKENDSIGDWELSHLVTIFKSILANCNRPIFFLIDGVDEAIEAEEILKFLASCVTLRNTKWCISSRGEEVFQQAFSKYNGLKLHEYTRDDMRDFARKEIHYSLENIQGYDKNYSEHFLEILQYSLVNKAEGVYLWLVIALESIKRGLRHNDREDVILSRLEKLPTGLEELYADMWGRLGEDKDIYQREAAHYFNLLIINRTLAAKYHEEYGASFFEWPLTPFQMMLAQDDELQRNLLDQSYELQLSKLENNCLDMTKSLSIKTAGLLTTQDNFRFRVREEYSQLEKHVTSKIEFVHRTLFDFLTDTESGRDILAQAQADHVYVQLATIMLCQLRIMETNDRELDLFYWESKLSIGDYLHYFRWVLSQAQRKDSLSNERVFNTLLPAFATLFEAGLIPWDQRPKGYPRPCFDILLLTCRDPAFQQFIRGRLKSKGTSYATCVLRECILLRDSELFWPRDTRVDLVELFNDLGADTNSTDACFCERPVDVGRFAGCFTYESALSAVIKALFYDTQIFGTNAQPDLLRYLVEFLENSPNLDTHTSCLFTSDESRFHNPDWNLCFLLSAITAGKNGDLVDATDIPGGRSFVAAIIMEVNLKYLVEIFLRGLSSNDAAINALKTRAEKLVELESSKAFSKARFIVTMIRTGTGPLSQGNPLLECYRFINEDIIFPMHQNSTQISRGFKMTYITSYVKNEDILKYISQCEKVDVSALDILIDQKLGVCLKEF
ncbi:hypothetical protein ACSS6W_000878 [Trichoderma asperelloides]